LVQFTATPLREQPLLVSAPDIPNVNMDWPTEIPVIFSVTNGVGVAGRTLLLSHHAVGSCPVHQWPPLIHDTACCSACCCCRDTYNLPCMKLLYGGAAYNGGCICLHWTMDPRNSTANGLAPLCSPYLRPCTENLFFLRKVYCESLTGPERNMFPCSSSSSGRYGNRLSSIEFQSRLCHGIIGDE
jgi:hypothetical protein